MNSGANTIRSTSSPQHKWERQKYTIKQPQNKQKAFTVGNSSRSSPHDTGLLSWRPNSVTILIYFCLHVQSLTVAFREFLIQSHLQPKYSVNVIAWTAEVNRSIVKLSVGVYPIIDYCARGQLAKMAITLEQLGIFWYFLVKKLILIRHSQQACQVQCHILV